MPKARAGAKHPTRRICNAASNDSYILGLPICSPNRRSLCGETRPPRAIQIFPGPAAFRSRDAQLEALKVASSASSRPSTVYTAACTVGSRPAASSARVVTGPMLPSAMRDSSSLPSRPSASSVERHGRAGREQDGVGAAGFAMRSASSAPELLSGFVLVGGHDVDLASRRPATRPAARRARPARAAAARGAARPARAPPPPDPSPTNSCATRVGLDAEPQQRFGGLGTDDADLGRTESARVAPRARQLEPQLLDARCALVNSTQS